MDAGPDGLELCVSQDGGVWLGITFCQPLRHWVETRRRIKKHVEQIYGPIR